MEGESPRGARRRTARAPLVSRRAPSPRALGFGQIRNGRGMHACLTWYETASTGCAREEAPMAAVAAGARADECPRRDDHHSGRVVGLDAVASTCNLKSKATQARGFACQQFGTSDVSVLKNVGWGWKQVLFQLCISEASNTSDRLSVNIFILFDFAFA